MANILLVGVDQTIARKIERASVQSNHSVTALPMCREFAECPSADLVFVSADHDDYLETIRSIRSYAFPPPVVVVTRAQKTSRWLDALGAGAADYCSAPFGLLPLKWVVDSALQTA